jgi:hypothetical protein
MKTRFRKVAAEISRFLFRNHPDNKIYFGSMYPNCFDFYMGIPEHTLTADKSAKPI